MRKSPRPFTITEKDRLANIMFRSKMGYGVSDEDMRFCASMYSANPDDYAVLDRANLEAVNKAMNPLYKSLPDKSTKESV